MQKNETGPLSQSVYKNQLKLIRNLNVRLETIKLLGNIGSKLLDDALGNDFLDMTPEAQATKEITDKGTASS